jgi:hypothetical protein
LLQFFKLIIIIIIIIIIVKAEGGMATIGVLALQGAFREHISAFAEIGYRALEVRTAKDLDACDGLVIPGGESTAIALIAQRLGMVRGTPRTRVISA